MLTRHIYLIGMPGAGKSTLGRRVAANLRLPFIDTDVRISEIFHKQFAGELVTEYGEEAFRTVETNMLVQITREPPAIVSTGGGLVLRDINRTIMRNSGLILLIDRDPEAIEQTARMDTRPLLMKNGVKATYDARIGIYRAAADLTFVCAGEKAECIMGLQRLITSRFQL